MVNSFRRYVLPALAFLGIAALLLVRPSHEQWFSPSPRVNAWFVVSTAIFVQALPFLVLGSLVSAAISAFASRAAVSRLVPKNPIVAVPVAGLAGMLLPGCECASVPTARRLMGAGVPRAAALAFLLASPAINPVVLAATAFAYRYQPMMVVARFSASILVAIVVGWIWLRKGVPQPRIERLRESCESSGWRALIDGFVHDFAQSAGWLVLGCIVAATVKTVVPTQWIGAVGSNPILGALVLGILSVLVALCSEADAFMAISFSGFSPIAQLVFLVVGPMVDVKLIAMQYGAFGGKFVRWFAPITFVVCLVVGSLVGSVLLSR